MRNEKRNHIITINRATANGIDQCGGEFFEAHGFQFCLTNSYDDGIYHAIELSTGISVCSRFTYEYTTEKTCIISLRRWLTVHRDKYAPCLIEKGKALLAEHGLNYPLNSPISDRKAAEKKGANKKKRTSDKWAALGGEPKKMVARLDPVQWERAKTIRDKYGFKSLYAMNQYLWACFLRVADPDNDTQADPVPEEIEMMFGDFSAAEKHFGYVKPKKAINYESLNNNKYNSKAN